MHEITTGAILRIGGQSIFGLVLDYLIKLDASKYRPRHTGENPSIEGDGRYSKSYIDFIFSSDEPVRLDTEPKTLRHFFSYLLYHSNDPLDFLSYHYKELFDSNLDQYTRFLTIAESENALLQARKQVVSLWVNNIKPVSKTRTQNRVNAVQLEETLPDLLNESGKKTWKWIQTEFQKGKRPKDYAKLYQALLDLDLLSINKNTQRVHRAMNNSFPNMVGTRQNFNASFGVNDKQLLQIKKNLNLRKS
jgi:hypothetical protein